MKLRKFQISCPVFWGFNRFVDVEKYNNSDDIIRDFLDKCEQFFKNENLLDLYEFFKTVKQSYHFHDISLEMIRNSEEDTIFYICRHTNCNNPMDQTITGRYN